MEEQDPGVRSEYVDNPQLFSPFKQGHIFPIKKPNGTYRPITLLSQLGKILERVLARRLSNLVRTDNEGCRANRGTDSCLLRLQHIATQYPTTILIALDIQKA